MEYLSALTVVLPLLAEVVVFAVRVGFRCGRPSSPGRMTPTIQPRRMQGRHVLHHGAPLALIARCRRRGLPARRPSPTITSHSTKREPISSRVTIEVVSRRTTLSPGRREWRVRKLMAKVGNERLGLGLSVRPRAESLLIIRGIEGVPRKLVPGPLDIGDTAKIASSVSGDKNKNPMLQVRNAHGTVRWGRCGRDIRSCRNERAEHARPVTLSGRPSLHVEHLRDVGHMDASPTPSTALG